MFKKILVCVSAICLVCFGFFMFKKPENSEEVVFWTLQMSDFAPYLNKVISDFEKGNPEIKIKWIDVPFSEGEKRTLASVLSDNPPDLVNLNPDFSATLAQKGALWEIDEKYTEQYLPELVESLKYNDRIYSLPWYATSAVTIYNKKLFEKAGISVPETYEQIAESAQQIKSKTGAYIFLPTITENNTMLKILNKYGVNSYDTINSETSADVFMMFRDLYAKDLIPKEAVTQTQREALEKYMSGNTALFQAGANFLNMIKENAMSTYQNTDVAPQIKGKLGQNDFSLMNFVIPLRAKHKDDALKFALFLTNSENQLELAKLTNILAVNKTSLQDEFYTKYDKDDLLAKARVISAKQLNKVNPVLQSEHNQKEINNIVNTAVQKIMLNQGDLHKILDELSKSWESLVKY